MMMMMKMMKMMKMMMMMMMTTTTTTTTMMMMKMMMMMMTKLTSEGTDCKASESTGRWVACSDTNAYIVYYTTRGGWMIQAHTLYIIQLEIVST